MFVLVHGAGGGADCWDRLLPHLDRAAVAVDLPGRGSRAGVDLASVTLDDCARAILDDVAATRQVDRDGGPVQVRQQPVPAVRAEAGAVDENEHRELPVVKRGGKRPMAGPAPQSVPDPPGVQLWVRTCPRAP